MPFLVELLDGGMDGAGKVSGALKRVVGEVVPLEAAQVRSIWFGSGTYRGSHSTVIQGR